MTFDNLKIVEIVQFKVCRPVQDDKVCSKCVNICSGYILVSNHNYLKSANFGRFTFVLVVN